MIYLFCSQKAHTVVLQIQLKNSPRLQKHTGSRAHKQDIHVLLVFLQIICILDFQASLWNVISHQYYSRRDSKRKKKKQIMTIKLPWDTGSSISLLIFIKVSSSFIKWHTMMIFLIYRYFKLHATCASCQEVHNTRKFRDEQQQPSLISQQNLVTYLHNIL